MPSAATPTATPGPALDSRAWVRNPPLVCLRPIFLSKFIFLSKRSTFLLYPPQTMPSSSRFSTRLPGQKEALQRNDPSCRVLDSPRVLGAGFFPSGGEKVMCGGPGAWICSLLHPRVRTSAHPSLQELLFLVDTDTSRLPLAHSLRPKKVKDVLWSGGWRQGSCRVSPCGP